MQYASANQGIKLYSQILLYFATSVMLVYKNYAIFRIEYVILK